MKEQIIRVTDLPERIDFNTTFEINWDNVNYFTHGFFKYPCRFIPLIPRWAILKYTHKDQLVLDPFAGSGTALVEAVLNRRNALGVDFDKLSQLLCKTKTQNLDSRQMNLLANVERPLFSNARIDNKFTPDIHNLSHWFPKENIEALLKLKTTIEDKFGGTQGEKKYNFLLVCFASIIKKCSYADDTSPKPYVSKRIKKLPSMVKEAFLKTLSSYLKNMSGYENKEIGKCKVISDDARAIHAEQYNGKVNLAVTSPPYINAFDYVRSLRLENAWLGYYGDSNILEVKRKQVGTETISSNIYSHGVEVTKYNKLDSILQEISRKDKKRAFVVFRFFKDMEQNLNEVKRLLKPKGHYVIVVGDSKIRGINIPTHEVLIDIARRAGYSLENIFSYIIKNRYLRIPRSGRGGLIKKDWVLDLVKKNG
jgi:DNA modification methylase